MYYQISLNTCTVNVKIMHTDYKYETRCDSCPLDFHKTVILNILVSKNATYFVYSIKYFIVRELLVLLMFSISYYIFN